MRNEDFSINTIIGPNTTIAGDVDSGGFTRIDGSLRGNLNAAGRVVVGEKARMRGSIKGTSVTIGGVIYGNIFASERVIILSTGVIIGDIITRRIQADEGCLVHGRVTVCSTEEQWKIAINEYRDAQTVRQVLAGFTYPSERENN